MRIVEFFRRFYQAVGATKQQHVASGTPDDETVKKQTSPKRPRPTPSAAQTNKRTIDKLR